MTKTRPATPTVAFIDQYCAPYRPLFKNVRHFEQFTALHLGLLAESRHKSLPQLGKTVHVDPQALHHFLANADWSVEAVRAIRLDLTRQALRERPFILCLDETGDRKKGHTTDYVASQDPLAICMRWPMASSRSTPTACWGRRRFPCSSASSNRRPVSSRETSTRPSRSWRSRSLRSSSRSASASVWC